MFQCASKKFIAEKFNQLSAGTIFDHPCVVRESLMRARRAAYARAFIADDKKSARARRLSLTKDLQLSILICNPRRSQISFFGFDIML
jgi:hypothetical protein